MASEKNTNISFKEKTINYFKGVKNEWSKVSWPTRQQVLVETIVVICVVTFFTIVVYIMDISFKFLLGLIK